MSEVGPVDDRAALPFRVDQSGPREDREVRGHSVVRNCESTRDLPSSKSFWLVFDQEPERIQARAL